MKAFMDKEFMLQSATAQHLYHDYAEDMPICDYHCQSATSSIFVTFGDTACQNADEISGFPFSFPSKASFPQLSGIQFYYLSYTTVVPHFESNYNLTFLTAFV